MSTSARATSFLVDSTAARLSRWLRFLGYDAVLDRSDNGAALLARARREGRVLLTRRRALGTGPAGSAAGAVLVLSSDFVSDQLKQVAAEFGLAQGLAPRCTVCNSELCAVSRAAADGRVPEFVYQSRSEFAFCPRCDKYYWKGTHWEHAGRSASAALSHDPERSRP
jgi:uncharacterized protein with PIN domain